ncbi:high affinity immunoglobulin epsilon receptor subunit beta-like [Anomaloglossus baeobatrachus]|uniref:high affinity immunoglobulin epsilon receptor subunit beta-like n=1 Tax=Anomaloglossus baeobatrachus TaxID=238106 RepID=UPI003F4F9CC7
MTQQQRNVFPVVPQGNQQFYRSIRNVQPKALGIVQIALVSLQISLGAILTSTIGYHDYVTALSGINYWGSLFYLTSGALSMLSEIKPSHFLMKVFLASNIFSCLTSFIEFCLICKDLNNDFVEYCCDCSFILKVNLISFAFLFMATVVQLSFSALLAVICWKSLKYNFDFASEVCVVNNEYRYAMSSESSQPT